MVPILNLPRTLFLYTSSSTRNSSTKKNSSTALLYNISLKMDLSAAPVAQTGLCHSTLDSLCKFHSKHTKFDKCSVFLRWQQNGKENASTRLYLSLLQCF
ncbi:unnamed protein product, partial [Brassica rapa]